MCYMFWISCNCSISVCLVLFLPFFKTEYILGIKDYMISSTLDEITGLAICVCVCVVNYDFEPTTIRFPQLLHGISFFFYDYHLELKLWITCNRSKHW